VAINVLRAPAQALFRQGRVRNLCAGAILVATAVAGVPARADEVVTRWAMPAVALPQAERPTGPNVFGTVALPVRAKPTSTRWAKVMHASLDQPVLERIADEARALSPEQDVAFVQSAVNRAIHTGAQFTNCSDDGYWAPAQETLARGVGDCFDVAIAKMEALRRLGIPDRDLYLTTGWFHNGYAGGKGRESVALLVKVGDRFWLLPEQSDRAYESGANGATAAFTPVVTYGVGMTWVHGKVVQVAALATAAGTGPVGASAPVGPAR